MSQEINIALPSQAFDVTFHPTEPLVFAGLLTGEILSYKYDDLGHHKQIFSLKPSRKSCRSIALSPDGSQLFTVGKGKALHAVDIGTSKISWSRFKAHATSINRVKCLTPTLLATGDDDGKISIWDTRENHTTPLRSYSHHFDHITDFLWFEEQKQLLATSGDGSLSVMDVRSRKEKLVHSEDQEDELLSVSALDGGSKILVGTQSGVLSLWDRRKGWGDCVDRVTGHPSSVDAMCTIPPSFQGLDTQRTVITGSSDGLVRVVQVLPTKLHGVVTDHGDWPVERIAIASGSSSEPLVEEDDSESSLSFVGEGRNSSSVSDKRCWVASVSHDETLRLSDLHRLSDGVEDDQEEEEPDERDSEGEVEVDVTAGSSPEPDEVKQPKRKRNKGKNKDELAAKQHKKEQELVTEGNFFSSL